MDTIAAPATPLLSGPVAVIRVSGPDAFRCTAAVFKPMGDTDFLDIPYRMLTYGTVWIDNAPADRAMAVKMIAPYSYTGEDQCELHLHGSLPVVRMVLDALYRNGARPAQAGEFTKRAFLHGKMDLVQAEAVTDLISAQTKDACRNAAGQLTGRAGRVFHEVYDKLADMLAHFAAVVDYPEEDLTPIQTEDMTAVLAWSDLTLRGILDSYTWGRILREGVRVAILGKPNVGKSSLLNALLGYDRAIVTPYRGTTRDTLEESLVFGGLLLRLTDAAGVRETQDPIEAEGINRAWESARDADVNFAVLDGSEPLTQDDRTVLDCLRESNGIVIVNKSDLPGAVDIEALEAAFLHVCRVSARTGDGLTHLESLLRRQFDRAIVYDGSVLSNARQYDALRRARDSVVSAMGGLSLGLTPDAVLGELELSLSALGEVIGRHISEDVLTKIFENFCVGK